MTYHPQKIYKGVSKVMTGLFVATLLLLASCKKDNDVSGPPVIDKITLLDSAKTDSAFVKALPGTLLLVTGKNLSGLTSVKFNGMDAYFNPAYNTNTHLIITIPGNAPTEATVPNVTNIITFTTNHGATTYSFVVDVPPPAISSVSNENALAGDSVYIYGSSLYLIEKIVLPGNRTITDVVTTPAGTYVGFVMPDLGNDTGRLVLYGKLGTAMSDGPLNDHQSGDVISNLTNDGEAGEQPVFNWAWWGANRSNDASMFPGTRGYYLQSVFGGLSANDPAWWNGGRSGNFNAVNVLPAAARTQPAANYALKFEVNTKEPWKAGVNVLRLGDNFAFRYLPYTNASDKVFDTQNEWRTVTVPLSSFKKADNGVEGTGANAVTVSDVLDAAGTVTFTYHIITEADPVDAYNTAYDNFRIVKIK
ncbi:glycan-binding surface protein [Chitinophaga sp. Hz27]|uniref:glycan-binding surface protein n=1 Tax=Chitinophaga sp. Hz27 TaxID=3347169 RepID=UPI0035E23959